MSQKLFFPLLLLVLVLGACSEKPKTPTGAVLTAEDFAQKLKQTPGAQLLDVRTPGEFAEGHLTAATNADWNGNRFDAQIQPLDKTKPVFVYCLSGGRSAEAAQHLRDAQFTEVYELRGGILKWRSAGLPETKPDNPTVAGMTREQFNARLKTDKKVLVDFYAEWCGPCKKMEPHLHEIGQEMAKNLEIIRIDADQNPDLLTELGIEALPTLFLYEKQELVWQHTGYMEKKEIAEQLEKH